MSLFISHFGFVILRAKTFLPSGGSVEGGCLYVRQQYYEALESGSFKPYRDDYRWPPNCTQTGEYTAVQCKGPPGEERQVPQKYHTSVYSVLKIMQSRCSLIYPALALLYLCIVSFLLHAENVLFLFYFIFFISGKLQRVLLYPTTIHKNAFIGEVLFQQCARDRLPYNCLFYSLNGLRTEFHK